MPVDCGEGKGDKKPEVVSLRLSSIRDLARLASSVSQVVALIYFEKEGVNVLGTFAQPFGSVDYTIFSYAVVDSPPEGNFLVYSAEETGEEVSYSNFIQSGGRYSVFPIIKLESPPNWLPLCV